MPTVAIPVAGGEGEGYLALPTGGVGAGVLVLHAWWGLTPVFRAVCDRLAAAGFVALAPDLYGGKTAATIDEAQALLAARDSAAMEARANGALAYLRGLREVRGAKIGLVGFSMGGGWSHALAAGHPEAVGAVAVFYDDSEAVPGTRAPVIGHFGTADEFADEETIAAVVAQWRTVAPLVTDYHYQGAHHWFVESDQPDYYDAEATELAWERTIAFLRAQLAA